MGRPLGSKNRRKCCTILSHCLTTKNESEYDDSVLDNDFEMPVDQCESQDRPTMSRDSGLCAGTKNVLFSSSALKYQRFLQFINKVVINYKDR